MTDPILLSGLIGRRDWNDLAWEAFRPGVRIHWLYRIGEDAAAGRSSATSPVRPCRYTSIWAGSTS
jgi:hypothetical protein